MRGDKIVLAVAVLIVAAGAFGIWNLYYRTEPLLVGTVEAPATIPVGENATFRIHLENPHAEPVTLESLDVDLSVLEGIEVISIDPEPIARTEIDLLVQEEWRFEREAAPGEKFTVTIEVRGTTEGSFGGVVDVTNPNVDYHSLPIDFEVLPPREPTATD